MKCIAICPLDVRCVLVWCWQNINTLLQRIRRVFNLQIRLLTSRKQVVHDINLKQTWCSAISSFPQPWENYIPHLTVMFFLHYLTNAILIENVITSGPWLLNLGIMNKIPSQESFMLLSPVSISEAGVILHLIWTTQAARLLFSLTACSPDLSEPVDVYSDWIDACEAANQ